MKKTSINSSKNKRYLFIEQAQGGFSFKGVFMKFFLGLTALLFMGNALATIGQDYLPIPMIKNLSIILSVVLILGAMAFYQKRI